MKLERIEGATLEEIVQFRKDNFEFHEDVEVPSWIEYFLNIAEAVSKRSKDAQTKIGCVLTDIHNHIISTGYNGLPRGLPDSDYPNLRPEKYPYFSHGEFNAILNTTVSPWSLQDGAIAYITATPCYICLRSMWAFNIKKIYYKDAKVDPLSSISKAENDIKSKILIKQTGIEVYKVNGVL